MRVDQSLRSVWKAMIRRCYRTSCEEYQYYGARGVTVCDRWRRYRNFVADMSPRPKGTSIDRIDNAGNYDPSNCRWATNTEQAYNRSDNHLLTFRGKTQCVTAWARELGIDRETIWGRLDAPKPWSVEDALTIPVGKAGKRRYCRQKLHRMDGENVLIDHRGARRCKACIEQFGYRYSPLRAIRMLDAEKITAASPAPVILNPPVGPWRLENDPRSGWWLENIEDDEKSTEWYGTPTEGYVAVAALNGMNR